jgi:hypothetical protein
MTTADADGPRVAPTDTLAVLGGRPDRTAKMNAPEMT